MTLSMEQGINYKKEALGLCALKTLFSQCGGGDTKTRPTIILNKFFNGTWSNIAKIDNLLAHDNVSLHKALRGVVGDGWDIHF